MILTVSLFCLFKFIVYLVHKKLIQMLILNNRNQILENKLFSFSNHLLHKIPLLFVYRIQVVELARLKSEKNLLFE